MKFKSNLLGFFSINQETLTTSPDCAGSSGRTGQRISGTALTRSGLLSARRVQYFLKRPKLDLLLEVDNCNKKITVGEGGGLVSKRRVDLVMRYCDIV